MQGRRLVVPGLLNKLVTVLPRLLPRAVVLRLMDFAVRDSNMSKK